MRPFARLLCLSVFAVQIYASAVAEPSPYEPSSYVKLQHPEWAMDAVIYQINTRQFTKEGTFASAQAHLPRLAQLGVDILWLMPIHPIGNEKRKGELGSPYAVRDYRAINPDLGDEASLRAFVDKAHALGMYVILDWVANHSAWDNPLTAQQPDWYTRTPEGHLMPPLGTDWSDTVDFDYSQAGLREYMTESLAYWVREFDIDGFRADVAGYVPLDFWENARASLDAIKPVFMLAEWETRDLHSRAFDATYAWGWKNAMQKTAHEGGAAEIRGYYSGQANTWPRNAYRMVYTDNHDQNAWDGVASQIYGEAYEAAIALSFVGSGIPLIHNGQEADLNRKLSFFGKDEIKWQDGRYQDLFRTLSGLKETTPALWNGEAGAPIIEVPNSADDKVFSFLRGDESGSRIFAMFNLSSDEIEITFAKARHVGDYFDVLTNEGASFVGTDSVALGPWGYKIFKSKLNAPGD